MSLHADISSATRTHRAAAHGDVGRVQDVETISKLIGAEEADAASPAALSDLNPVHSHSKVGAVGRGQAVAKRSVLVLIWKRASSHRAEEQERSETDSPCSRW